MKVKLPPPPKPTTLTNGQAVRLATWGSALPGMCIVPTAYQATHSVPIAGAAALANLAGCVWGVLRTVKKERRELGIG
jgi:hypothetical protein